MARHARQNPTEPDTLELSSQQEAAVDLLISGRNVTETAESIDVTRQTVSGWMHHHPAFQAALNARRQELWEGMIDRLRGLVPAALDVIERELQGDKPLEAAIRILKAAGLERVGAPTGPTEVEDVVAAEQQRAGERAMMASLASLS